MARNPLTPYRSGGLLGGGLDDIFSLHRDMNRLFDQVMGSGSGRGGGSSGGALGGNVISAQMNVSETDNEIRIAAELPGVTEDDIDVSLDDDVLTIRGEKRFERKDEKENFHFVERSYGTFQRAVRLPFPVDPEQVQASFENGVLTIRLPKSAQQERTRRIPVQKGQGGGQALQMTAQGGEGGGQQSEPAAQPSQEGQQQGGQEGQGS